MITQFTVTIEFQTELFLNRRDYVVASLAEIETIRSKEGPYNYKVVGHSCQQIMSVREVHDDIANERRAQAKIAHGA